MNPPVPSRRLDPFRDLNAGLEADLQYAAKDRTTLALLLVTSVLVLGVLFAAAATGGSDPASFGAAVLAPGSALLVAFYHARASTHYAWRTAATFAVVLHAYLLTFALSGAFGTHAFFVLAIGFTAIYADGRLPVLAFGATLVVHPWILAFQPAWLGVADPGVGSVVGRLSILGFAAALATYLASAYRHSLVRARDARAAHALEADARAESERENERRLVRLVDALPLGLLLLDTEGRVVRANPTAQTLFQRRIVPGAAVQDALRGVDTALSKVGEALAQKDRRTVEVKLDSPAGPRVVLLDATHLEGHGLVVSLLDVTERRRSEEELDRARRHLAHGERISVLGSMTSGIAHEIRTPLAYIANVANLGRFRLVRALRGDADLRHAVEEHVTRLEDILEGVNRINHFVNDIRRFSQPETGAKTPHGVHEVVRDAVEVFRATHKTILVHADLQTTVACELNPVEIQQVVLNLLENAADAMGGTGTVRVATRHVPGGAEVVVEDRGPGIPLELQERVFDEFFTTRKDGTGLGLAIVRRIVSEHGGTIALDSRPGEGARFTVHLPQAKAARPPSVVPLPAAARP